MGQLDIKKIIARCDEFFNAGNPAAAGEFLREMLALARQEADRSAQLTLLNELIGHYRMSCDPQRGMAAIADAETMLALPEFDRAAGTGVIRMNIATALHSFGRNREALAYYMAALADYQTDFPAGDRRFSGLYNNMAAVYASSGDFAGAEKYYLMALDILQTYQARCDAAVTCVNLAGVYMQRSDPALAETFLECAMEFFSDPALLHDGYFAHSCLKCAPVFGRFGRPEEMEKLNRLAQEVYERN